jgi:hypothetical protein
MNNFLEGVSLQVIEKNGTPEWIRTTDLLLRRLPLSLQINSLRYQ